MRLLGFAHELQSLDPENPEKQHPEAEVENRAAQRKFQPKG